MAGLHAAWGKPLAVGLALIELALPGSFQMAHGPGVVWKDPRSRAHEFLRLSIFSLATVSGSSDAEVAPATGFASCAASLEAMTGQFDLVVVIDRRVGIDAAPPPGGPTVPDAGARGNGDPGPPGVDSHHSSG